MAKAGKFVGGTSPYGYTFDPNDKHHLIIEPSAADAKGNWSDIFSPITNVPKTYDFVGSVHVISCSADPLFVENINFL